MRYRFGGFVLDTTAGRLLRDGMEVPLQPRTYELLRLVVQRPGELVGREELIEALWPDVNVTPNSLEQVVSRARRALRPETPLRTVPRRGYRFDATVLVEEDPATTPAVPEVLGPRPLGNLDDDFLPLLGRDLTLATLVDRLRRGERLLTLTGPGGVGKTTLARHVVRQVRDDRLSAWFIDLSAARDIQDVLRAVAGALEIELDGDQPVLKVGQALRRLGPAVVILDNFEQVVPIAAATLGRWLRDAPEAAFVVTSRVVLGIRGEHVFPVEPLAARDAALLLAERSGLPDDTPDLLALAEALEGLPLALELAARRLRLLSPTALLARLRDRFSLLTDPSGDRPARHRSLEAALQDSWELLEPAERDALGQLTVFVGSFDLPAAEHVVQLGRQTLDVLQALGDQSLLRALSGDRFALLDTIRAFAAERADPASLHAAEARHGAWFSRHQQADSPDRATLTAELDDVIAACRRAIARGNGPLAIGCALAAFQVLIHRGPLDLGTDLLEQALPLADPKARIDLLSALGQGYLSVRPERATVCLREALERLVGTPREGVLLLDLGTSLQHQGLLDQAEQAYRRAISLLREAGDRYHEGLALTRLGGLFGRLGRGPDALRLQEEAVAIFQELGNVQGLATATANLALELDSSGQPEAAEQRYREALVLQRRAGHELAEENVRGNLAILLARAGRLDESLAEMREALALARRLGRLRAEARHLENLGALHLERGELDEAGLVLAEALAANQRLGRRRGEAHSLLALGSLHRRRQAYRAATDALERALELLEGGQDRRLRITAYVERCALYLETGAVEAARCDLERARELASGGLDTLTRSRMEDLEARLARALRPGAPREHRESPVNGRGPA